MTPSALAPGSSSFALAGDYDVACTVSTNNLGPSDLPVYPIEPDVPYDWDTVEAEDPDRNFPWPELGIDPYPRLKVCLYEQAPFLRLYTDCDGIKKVAVTDGVEHDEFVSERSPHPSAVC